MDMIALGEVPTTETFDGIYLKMRLADCCYLEVYRYGGPSDIGLYYWEADSMLLVRTVCAPLCSSVAQIYDGHWNLIREILPPSRYTLPQAFINEQGSLTWQENYMDETDTLTDTPK